MYTLIFHYFHGRGGLLYLDLTKGTLFRTLLGTFSEGVFAVHSEFSAVKITFIKHLVYLLRKPRSLFSY